MVAHLHSVYDTDKHFTIDPVTRVITNQSEKLKLMQYDHKSERYTFELPRYIEGHDMLECDRIEIHYDNISKSKKDVNSDVYIVTDIQASADDDIVAVFSWLIEIGCTMYPGKLNFRITFKCLSEEGNIDYEWNTETFKSIAISEGINNTEKIPELYPDALEQIRLSLSKQIEESPNTYIVTVILGQFSVLSPDKTYAEVLDAITKGKNVIVKYIATYMIEWLRLARIKNEIITFATEAYDTNFLYRTITFQLIGDETQVYQSWDYLIDNKLEESGRAADAKVVGDKFSTIEPIIENITPYPTCLYDPISMKIIWNTSDKRYIHCLWDDTASDYVYIATDEPLPETTKSVIDSEKLASMDVVVLKGNSIESTKEYQLVNGIGVISGVTYSGSPYGYFLTYDNMIEIQNSMSEIAQSVGSLELLKTLTKDSTVNAINELKSLSDSLKPKLKSVDLPVANWIKNGTIFSQVVTIDGVTEKSKIDLQPTSDQLSMLYNTETSMTAVNDAGTVTILSIGAEPLEDMTMQVLVTEVFTE